MDIPGGGSGWNVWGDVDNPGSLAQYHLIFPHDNDEIPIWDDSVGTWKRTRWQDLSSGGGGGGSFTGLSDTPNGYGSISAPNYPVRINIVVNFI